MKKKTKKKAPTKTLSPRNRTKTITIEVPEWSIGTGLKDKHSLPSLVSWCCNQEDVKHQIIGLWLKCALDTMGLSTLTAFKKSQIDSRKKPR